MAAETLRCAVECRASESGPTLCGVILTEGRASTGTRREVFAPGAAQWPAEGIELRTVHLGNVEARAVPVRGDNGEISVEAPASPALFAAVHGGARGMSVEFHALEERTIPGGVREVLKALVVGAIVTNSPEYDTTRAEVRERRRPAWWL